MAKTYLQTTTDTSCNIGSCWHFPQVPGQIENQTSRVSPPNVKNWQLTLELTGCQQEQELADLVSQTHTGCLQLGFGTDMNAGRDQHGEHAASCVMSTVTAISGWKSGNMAVPHS